MPRAERSERARFTRRRTTVIAIVMGVGLLAAGVAYAEGVLGDSETHGPVVAAAATFTSVAEYPGWSYAAGTSSTGTPCIVMRTTLGEGRTCATTIADAGLLTAGFVTDEATGARYGYVTGFTGPGEEAHAAFSDGTSRTVTSTAEGAYFVAVTPADIDGGVLPVSVTDAGGAPLVPSLPREVFEAGR